MFIKSYKGQGIIAEIILFSVTIFLSVILFLILSSQGIGQQQQSADITVESSRETITHRSVLTTMINGNVWRADSVDARYNDMTALELTSKLFSTEGDLYINGEKYKREDVKNDLESYYEFRMKQNFLNVPVQSDNALNISYKDMYIDVENIDGRGGSWSSMQVPFQLSNGRVGQIKMYVKGSGGVFKVE